MKKAIDKVPNIVFLIIAIAAIAVAGVIFALYSLEKERAVNSLNEIARLEKDVNKLMNKNSDLMMQMGGIEDQKEQLEEKIKEDKIIKCDTNECLMSAPLDNVYGLAKVKGYYMQQERTETNPASGEIEGKVLCDRFIITGGPDKLIEDYLKKAPSAFFDKNDDGQPIINISLSNLSDSGRELIKNSSIEDEVDITIFDRYQPPAGHESASVCTAGVDIFRVD